MKILVSGSSGLVGSALISLLRSGGHQTVRLVRSTSQGGKDAVVWDPEAGTVNPAELEGFDAVVHLAGENIAARRWSEEQKSRLRNSRVNGTRHLCDALARLERPPQVLANASAIGYYGSRGDEIMTEDSTPGTGFLVDICKDWEAATAPAAAKGIRVVLLRFGVILSGTGGPLTKMLTPFKLGLGGKIGDGRQYFSWVTLDDAIGATAYALTNEALRGPVNVVAPRPVTNAEFTRTLGRVLGRPTIFPMPAFAARLAFGEMADELLLSSTRVEPKRLLANDYPMRYPELEGALRHVLGKAG